MKEFFSKYNHPPYSKDKESRGYEMKSLCIGQVITAMSVHGKIVTGKVEWLNEHTVIVSDDSSLERVVVSEKELEKQGLTWKKPNRKGTLTVRGTML